MDTSGALCGPTSTASVLHGHRTNDREREAQPGPYFVERMAVRHRVAEPEVERQVIADLPDQAHQARYGFCLPELPLVENLGHRPHGPFRGTLDDRADKEIAMVLAGERRGYIQVDGSPIPAL